MINEFIEKAGANLAVADLCFENEFFDAAANRAYYAAFQAAVAALARHGFTKDRLDHEWVQAQMNTQLIRRAKICPDKIKSHLPKMQTVRNIADYEPKRTGKKVAQRQIAKAEEMISVIGKEVI